MAVPAQVVKGPALKLATESKYVDGYLDDTALTSLNANDATWAGCEVNPRQSTAVYGCLPVPKQGDSYSSRDGRKIFIKNIRIKGILTWGLSDTVTAATYQSAARVVVVKDTRTNGVTLNAEDVLGPGEGSDGNASLNADAALMAFSKPNGWGRYKILKDQIFRLPPLTAFNDGTDGAINGYEMPFKFSIPVNDYVNFDDAAGAIASIVDNSYHVLAATNGAANVTISYVCRTAFLG